MRPKSIIQIIAFLLICSVLLGCATQSATVKQFEQPFDPRKHSRIFIERCVDRTGYKGDHDLAEEATHALTEKVRNLGLFEISPDAPLVLTCSIERFSEGSALKRWVLPGWGTTNAQVSVMAWEKPGDKVMATFRSQSSVEAGGFYTVGADQYILAAAMEDIVKQLKVWVTGVDSDSEDQDREMKQEY
jgi:hypothetical protein